MSNRILASQAKKETLKAIERYQRGVSSNHLNLIYEKISDACKESKYNIIFDMRGDNTRSLNNIPASIVVECLKRDGYQIFLISENKFQVSWD